MKLSVLNVLEVKNIGGEDVEVKLLPSLSTDDILGQPVIAFVDKGKPLQIKKVIRDNTLIVSSVKSGMMENVRT